MVKVIRRIKHSTHTNRSSILLAAKIHLLTQEVFKLLSFEWWRGRCSVRPLVIFQLRVVFRVTVLHCDTPGQDGGYVVPHWLPLTLLLLLLLDFLELDACEDDGTCERNRRQRKRLNWRFSNCVAGCGGPTYADGRQQVAPGIFRSLWLSHASFAVTRWGHAWRGQWRRRGAWRRRECAWAGRGHRWQRVARAHVQIPIVRRRWQCPQTKTKGRLGGWDGWAGDGRRGGCAA